MMPIELCRVGEMKGCERRLLPGTDGQHQRRSERAFKGERDRLLGDGEDVVSAAHHVARLPVRLDLRPLRRVPVASLHPLDPP